MYCIKCGKNSQSSEMLCEDCRGNSGFGEVQGNQAEKRRTYAMYLAMIGNFLLLLGMLCSFILIENDAQTDYVAEIFEEKSTGPVETDATEETETTDDSGEETQEETVQLEEKGYRYSVAGYLCRRTLDEENEEDFAILQNVLSKMNQAAEKSLNLDDAQQVERIIGSSEDAETQEIIETLEYYSGYDVAGVLTVLVVLAGLVAACWLLSKKNFRWSALCSLVAIIPVWRLIVKLDGITAWKFQYGMYLFVAGIFAVIIGVLAGGNTEACSGCKTVLPGGAVFCAKCGNSLFQKKQKGNAGMDFIRNHSMVIATVGNIVMFLPVILPMFSAKTDGETAYMSIMGLRGLQNVEDKGMSGILSVVLLAGIALLIGAVVTSIFEKTIVSMGCSLGACAVMVIAVSVVQNIVELKTLFTIVFIPLGLAAALVAGLNTPDKKERVKEG